MMSSQTRRSAGTFGFTDTWTGAGQAGVLPIPDLLRGLEAVAVAVIATDGSLKDANRGFLLLMTRNVSSPKASDVRELFAIPRFADLLHRLPDPFDGTVYSGMLSFGRPGSRMTSLRGAIYDHDGDLVVVAEHDVVGLEVLRNTLMELQDDLEEKQRTVVRLEQRIQRLQELTDALVRDRDTLLDALARHGLSTHE